MARPISQIIKPFNEHKLEFARSVARGLSDSPKYLDCRYLYDASGSEIFERICEQPEYYLTRTETKILQNSAGDIASRTGQVSLVEFGSGSSIKTQIILKAYAEMFGAVRYTPVDISKSILEQAQAEIVTKHPKVKVDPFHGHYEEAFRLFPQMSPTMFLFLGSSVGNFNPSQSIEFWDNIRGHLLEGDYCLLGIDTTDDPDVIHAAYNDGAGYSAAFTKNIFTRINRELGASIKTDEIEHVAGYEPDRQRVEIFAKFQTEQTIEIKPLNKKFHIGAGDMIMTEISRKFRLDQMVTYLHTFGLRTEQAYQDELGRFTLLLLERQTLADRRSDA